MNSSWKKQTALFLTSQAVSLFGSSLVQFAAPAMAGLVLTFSTLRLTLMIDIITAAVGISVFSFVTLPKRTVINQEAKASVFSEMLTGIRYAGSESFLKKLLIVNGIFIFLCVPAGFLAALYVSRTYGDSYAYLTVLLCNLQCLFTNWNGCIWAPV